MGEAGGMVEAGWKLLTAAVAAALGALAEHNGLAVVLTSLGGLAMILIFAGWVVTRPNTGSFKIGPIEWECSRRESSLPKEPEAPVPKRRRWLRRKPPPDS
jgi:hypothetical protein